jgi:hypothetical protein
MKAIKKLVLFLLVGTMAANYGCNKEETQDNPNLSVTASKTTASPGDVVDIAITTSSAGRVDRLLIQERTQGSSVPGTLLDSAVKQANFGYTHHYTVPNNATAPIDIVVTVTDDKAQTTTKTVTITVTGNGNLSTCDNKTLGSYDNTTGSFFSAKTCTVYTVGEAKNNQSAVDFIYFYGTTNFATIAAPDDADANTISTFQLNTWTTKNATRFKTVSGFDYANATGSSITLAWTTGGAEMSKINNLGVGQMFLFKTTDGRYGVAKVNSISGTSAGTINLDVKSTM